MTNPAQKYILISPNGVRQTMLLTEGHLKVLLGQGFTLVPEPVIRRAIVEDRLVTKGGEE